MSGLRRYSEMKKSSGTRWPPDVAAQIRARDFYRCVGPRIGMPGVCFDTPQIDHVRASHGIGMKSPSTVENGALLCSPHHKLKTENGKVWRPKLLDYLAKVGA